MPVLGYLFIEATGDRFTITANNLNEALQFRKSELECGIGSMLVPFEALNRTLKSVRKGTYLTFSEDGGTGTIKYDDGTLKGSIPFEAMDTTEFPPLASIQKESKVVLTKEAVSGLLEAAQSASTDENRFLLNSVCLESSRIVATDGKQLYSSNSFNMNIKDKLLIPLSKVMRVINPDEPAEIIFDGKSKGTFIQGNFRWHFKAVEGNYPNYNQVIPEIKTYKTVITLSDEDAEAILKAPLPTPKKRGDPVTALLVKDGNKVGLHCGSKAERQSIPLNAMATGPNCRVCFNIDFLKQSLKQGNRKMSLKSELDPVLMTDESRMHLFMPFRIDSDTGKNTSPKSKPQPRTTVTKKNQQNGASNGSKTSSALDLLSNEVNAVKEAIKTATSQLNGLQSVIRDAVKERRDLEKEHAQIKKSIRSLQTVQL